MRRALLLFLGIIVCLAGIWFVYTGEAGVRLFFGEATILRLDPGVSVVAPAGAPRISVFSGRGSPGALTLLLHSSSVQWPTVITIIPAAGVISPSGGIFRRLPGPWLIQSQVQVVQPSKAEWEPRVIFSPSEVSFDLPTQFGLPPYRVALKFRNAT